MALPLSRNTTYAAGAQVKSADLNDIQDKIVDNYFVQPRRMPAGAGYEGGTGTAGTLDDAGTHAPGATTKWFVVPFELKPGTRLTEVRARVKDTSTGGGTVTLDVRKSTDGSGASVDTDVSAGDGSVQTLAVTAMTEDVPAAGASVGEVYLAKFTFATAITTTEIYSVEFITAAIP